MANENIKLNFLILCDNASLNPSGKLNIMGVFDTINSVDFPAVHKRMSIVVNVNILEGFYTEILKIKKGGREIASAPETEIKKDNSGTHQFIHNFSNTVFPEDGEYSVEVYVNKNLIGTTKLFLKKVP